MTESDKGTLWETIREQLHHAGIDLERLERVEEALVGGDMDAACMKIVCVPLGLEESLQQLGKSTRDRVVMVRVDEETSRTLDAWVETGAVKSRSEAAALFIRQGLEVRANELEQLGDALKGVEEAKQRLRQKAGDVFGSGTKEE